MKDIRQADRCIKALRPRLSDDRAERIETVISQRTRNLTVVTEAITDVGNINACMRSAEAMGLVDFHVVEAEQTFYRKGKRTSMGANKWLDIHRWRDSASCLHELKSQGMQIVATAITDSAIPIAGVDFTRPTAIVLGNEHQGVSDEVLAAADQIAYIPMYGFVESYNISVACALSLYTAVTARGQAHADLSDDQKLLIKARYYQKATRQQ